VSGRGGLDAFGQRKPGLEPYCKRPNAGGPASGHLCRSVRSLLSHCDRVVPVEWTLTVAYIG
jgi:hypothetical protein